MMRVTVGCIVALGLVLGGAVSAQAGEVNGKGEWIPGAHVANSNCAYSGKDLPDSVENNPPRFDDDSLNGVGNVQSYGATFVKNGLKEIVPSPGDACRGGVPLPGE